MAKFMTFLIGLCVVSTLVCLYWRGDYFSTNVLLLAKHATEYIKVGFNKSTNNLRHFRSGGQPYNTLRISDIDHASLINQPYLLLLPDDIPLTKINQSWLAEAVKLLHSNEYLNAIGGFNEVVNQTVHCSGFIADWTIYLSNHNEEQFNQSQLSLDIASSSRIGHSCRRCFLLPYGPIFFRSSGFLHVWKSLHTKAPGGFSKYGIGFLYSLLISLNGTGAYCPDIQFISSSLCPETQSGAHRSTLPSVSGSLCAKTFGFPFDQKFVMLADLLDIYRIVLPSGVEAWTNCEWDHALINSTASCANWHFRYLQDLVKLFRDYFGWDYRLLFGTALGAIRDGNIIPWTTDLDIIPVPFPSGKKVYIGLYRDHIREASGELYDYVTIDNQQHYAPYRLVPRCPVIVDKEHHTTAEEMSVLSKMFQGKSTTKSAASNWRNVPYGDVFEPTHLTWHNTKDKLDISSDLTNFDWSKIRDMNVKLMGHARQYLESWYGKNWTIPPVRKRGFRGRNDNNV